MLENGAAPVGYVVGAWLRDVGVRNFLFQQDTVQLCVALMEKVLCPAVEDVSGLWGEQFRVQNDIVFFPRF